MQNYLPVVYWDLRDINQRNTWHSDIYNIYPLKYLQLEYFQHLIKLECRFIIASFRALDIVYWSLISESLMICVKKALCFKMPWLLSLLCCTCSQLPHLFHHCRIRYRWSDILFLTTSLIYRSSDVGRRISE